MAVSPKDAVHRHLRVTIIVRELTKTEKFNLLIAGYGNKIIEDKCEEVKDRDNVKYFGRLSMKDGLEMEANADIISTIYCKTNPNHIFAAPNKYYEALYLGKPILTNSGTIVSKKVHDNNIGYVIEEDEKDLIRLLSSINKKDIEEKGKKARELWNNRFKDYVQNFFDTQYSHFLK